MGDLILINAMDDTLNNLSAVFVTLLSLTLGFQEAQAHFLGVGALQWNFDWSISTRSEVCSSRISLLWHDQSVMGYKAGNLLNAKESCTPSALQDSASEWLLAKGLLAL